MALSIYSFLDMLPLRIYAKKLNGRFAYMNARCRHDMGVPDGSDVTCFSDSDFFVEEVATRWNAEEQAIIDGGMPVSDRIEFETWKNGDKTIVRTWKYGGAAFWGPDVALVGFSIDITDDYLNDSYQRMAMSAANDGFWYRDLNSGTVKLSSQWKKMLGYREDEFEETFSNILAHIVEEDRARFCQTLDECVNGSSASYFSEFRMIRKDGSWCDIRSRGTRETDPLTGALFVAGVHTDITIIKSQERLIGRIVDAVPGFIFCKDGERRFKFVNKAICMAFGMQRDEILERRDEDLNCGMTPEEIQAFQLNDRRVIDDREVVEVDERFHDSRGTERVLHTIKVPARDVGASTAGGDEIALIGVSTDITARVAAAEEVAEERRRLIAVLDRLPVGVFFRNSNGCFTSINREFRKLFLISDQMDVEDVLLEQLVGGPAARKLIEEDQVILATGQAVHDKMSSIEINSVLRDVVVSKFRIGGLGGRTEVCGVIKDVTDILDAEKKLSQHGTLLSTVIDAVESCIYAKDKEFRYISANKAFLRRVGVSSIDALIDKKKLTAFGSEAASVFQNLEKQVFADPHPVEWVNVQVSKRDDNLREVELSVYPLKDPKLGVFGVVGVFDDAERVERLRKFGAFSASTRIGECLSRWIRILELSVSTFTKSEVDNGVRRIGAAVRYLSGCVRRMTLLGDFRQVDLRLDDLGAIARRVVAAFDDSRIRVTETVAPVYCEVNRVEAVIAELVDNAIHFGIWNRHDGRINVEVRRSVKRSSCWEVYVEDNGFGFERAYGVDAGFTLRSSDAQRLGLGIAFAKEVMDKHGGAIEIGAAGCSNSISGGKGCRCTLTFPEKPSL